MKKLAIAVVFAFVSVAGMAQEKATKDDVIQVIQKSGANGQMAAAKNQLLGMIPKEKQAAFLVEFEVVVKKINDKTAEIYMEEYTKDDIKAMLDFYNSPVGKKMAEKAEKIAGKAQESMASLQGEIQSLLMKYMQ